MSRIVITSEHKFRRTVTARKPVDAGYEDITFDATFRCLPLPKLEQLTDDARAFEVGVVEIHSEMEIDGRTLTGDALKAALAEIQYMRSAIVRAYFNAVNGARAGN